MRGAWHGIVAFVVGDDIQVAIAVVALLGLAAAIAQLGGAAWWVLPVGVPAALWRSLRRASREAGAEDRR